MYCIVFGSGIYTQLLTLSTECDVRLLGSRDLDAKGAYCVVLILTKLMRYMEMKKLRVWNMSDTE